MEFRVLGPLEVQIGGQLLPLRGRRQRALLALLVLSANEVVPDDRLLEDLWGDELPGSGRAALRVRVSQLRKGTGRRPRGGRPRAARSPRTRAAPASVLDIPRLQLALVRGDLDAAARLLETPLPTRGWYRDWMALATIVTRLHALATMRDRPGVEAEAASHLRPKTYLEPFALRSLGVVREDEALVARALAGFEKLGLGWHAEQTRALL